MDNKNRLFDCDILNGSDGKACVIAEAGINHDGSVDKAKALIEAAEEAGASCVKFQAFRTEHVSSRYSTSSSYMVDGSKEGESAYELSKRLELSDVSLRDLHRFSNDRGLPWIASFFDEYSLELLVSLDVPVLKVASALITDLPLLKKAAQTSIPLIVSTGMASLDEIDTAVDLLREGGANFIYLMHCISWYPAKAKDMNLRVIDLLQKRYDLPVGLSDHTMGYHVACAARARGVKLFEKHFTLSCEDFGPDHAASLEPEQLSEMIGCINEVGMCLGTGEKQVSEIEMAQRNVFRKSIVAESPIACGTVVKKEHLSVKRPGYGIPPGNILDIVGKRVNRDIGQDECITWEMVE